MSGGAGKAGRRPLRRLFLLLLPLILLFAVVLPVRSQEISFTLDFETGDLRGWTKTGNAFDFQPTLNDNPTARNRGQPSKHQGRYWIGTYERYQGRQGQKPGDVQDDGPTGILTSAPFSIPKGTLSFLVGGGSGADTRVELLVAGESGGLTHSRLSAAVLPKPVLSASGQNSETMRRVTWDLDPFAGKKGAIRIVDGSSGGWGHINVDDFRFASRQAGTSDGPARPQARISPSSRRVTQGEKANFQSRSTHDPDIALIRQEWQGPGGRRGEGRSFTVSTDDLPPGTYEIGLAILDDREQGDKASATLEVLPRAIAYRLDLRASPAKAEEGKAVKFEAALSPRRDGAEYRFSFGDGNSSGWSRDGSAVHTYQKQGSYNATVAAREGEEIIAESGRTRIEVTQAVVERRVSLTVDRQRARVDEAVRFRAVLEPPMDKVEYLFSFGDWEVKNQAGDPMVEHRYRSEGTFSALVSVRVAGKTIAESPAVAIAVERQMEKPVARISPPQRTVRQGEKAVFENRSTNDPGTRLIREEWSGPQGQSGKGRSFTVTTESLQPGKYGIGLSIVDERKQGDKTSATLEVLPPISYRLTLDADPRSIPEGQRVRFRATLTPGLPSAEYRFSFGDGSSSPWSGDASVDHSYSLQGAYQALAEVREGGRLLAKSAVIPVDVSRPVEGPSARIMPGRVEVLQGRSAVFESRSTPAGELREVWRGPGGQQGEGGRFEVNTGGLASGRYEIVLDVSDRRGNTAGANAELEVLPTPSGPEGPASPGSLSLVVDPPSPKEGEKAVFTITAGSSDDGMEYRLFFGDGEAREWSAERQVEHVYGKAGAYSAFAIARVGDRIVFESRPVVVTVEKQSSPLRIPWVEIITGLFIAGGYYLISRIRRGRGKKLFKPALSIRPVIDLGGQEIEGGYGILSSPTVRLRPEADQGEQEMESEGPVA